MNWKRDGKGKRKKQVRFEDEKSTKDKLVKRKRKQPATDDNDDDEVKVEKKPEEEAAGGQWHGTGAEIALNNWLQQISYVEANLKTCKSLQLGVDEALDRMRMDGPVSYKKLDELKSIGTLWR